MTATPVQFLQICCLPSYRGKFSGSEEQRLAILRSAAQQGAKYVDIDVDAAETFLTGAHPGACAPPVTKSLQYPMYQ